MRNYVGMLTIAGLMTVSGVAFAEEVTGMISEIDREAMTVTLDTGETIMVPEQYLVQDLQVGNQVTVVYEEQNGEMVAESLYEVEER